MLDVDVKWRAKSLGKFQVSPEWTVSRLKSLVQEMTGVEAENQKLLYKGKVLKDGDSISCTGLRNGDSVLMMGTPSSSIPQIPVPPSQGATEGRTEGEIVGESSYEPRGLVNLGNTCYLNSSLQSMLSIEGLMPALRLSPSHSSLLSSISSLERQLQDSPEPVIPLLVLSALHKRFPQMAQKDEQGHFCQQDAEECWSLIIQEMSSVSPSVSRLLTGELAVRLSSSETDEVFESKENFLKLDCHIGQDTTELLGGIKAGFTQKLTKFSDKLQRDVEFEKTSTISEYPPFLVVNFIRFFWKPREQVKAKILKKVKFPLLLDLSSLASSQAGKPVEYDLISVITHIGRSADSGHYISWTKDLRNNAWRKFDDEKVTPITEDEIKKLDGGGDWHTAYLCIYKNRSP